MFEDKVLDYDLANHGRDFPGGPYPHRCAPSNAEYEAWHQAIFHLVGLPPPQASGHAMG